MPTTTNWGIFLGAESLGLPSGTMEIVKERLQPLSRFAVTHFLTRALQRFPPPKLDEWIAFDREVLRPILLRNEVLERVRRLDLAASVKHVVMHRNQLLACLGLAQHWCRGEIQLVEEDDRRRLGDALLAISDLLEPEVIRDQTGLLSATAVMLPVFADSNFPDALLGLCRTRRLLAILDVDQPPILTACKNRCEEDLGLSMLDLFLAENALFAKLENQREKQGLPQNFPLPPLPEAISRRLLQAIAVPFDQLPSLVPGPEEIILKRSGEPFRTHPAIVFPDGTSACADPTFLIQHCTNGLRWRLLQYAMPAERETAFREWGDLFARYLHERLGRAVGKRYTATPLDPDANELGDGLIDAGENAVILEYKSALLTDSTKRSGSPVTIAEELEAKFLKGGQIARSLERSFGLGLHGKPYLRAMRGARPKGVRRVYPILVAEDSGLCAHTCEQFLADAVAADVANLTTFGKPAVRRLHLLSVDDADSVAFLISRGRDLVGLLRDRHRADPEHQNTFHNRLVDEGLALGLNTLCDPKEYKSLTEETMAFLRRVNPPNVV